jgi:hypothetical protein
MIPCPSRNALLQFLDDSLADDTAESVRLHVRECTSCQSTLKTLSESSDLPRPENLSDPLVSEPRGKPIAVRQEGGLEARSVSEQSRRQRPEKA